MELKDELLPFGFQFIYGEIVNFGNYGAALHQNPHLLIRDMYLCMAGLLDRGKWRVLVGNYHFLIKHYQVTCAIFRRV